MKWRQAARSIAFVRGSGEHRHFGIISVRVVFVSSAHAASYSRVGIASRRADARFHYSVSRRWRVGIAVAWPE